MAGSKTALALMSSPTVILGIPQHIAAPARCSNNTVPEDSRKAAGLRLLPCGMDH